MEIISNPSKSTLLRPLYLGLGYTISTLALFLWGPYVYTNFAGIWLYVFLFAVYYAIYRGFTLGVRSTVPLYINNKAFPLRKTTNILFWLSLILAVPKFEIYSGFPELNPTFLLARAAFFFTDAQSLYLDKFDSADLTGIWRYINWVIVISGPFTWAYTFFAILNWKNLSLFKKLGTIFIWLMYSLEYLITGTNFGLFDLVISIGMSFSAIKVRSSLTKVHFSNKKGKKGNKGALLVAVGVVALLVFIFNTSMSSRIGETYENSGGEVAGVASPYNPNSFILRLTPVPLQPVLSYTTSYVSQPYSPLSLAMTVDYSPIFGVGHSKFLLDNMPEYFWNNTYQVKLEKQFGYDRGNGWHTAYTWFANDVTFFLVPFLFFFLFLLYGKAWKEYVVTGNIGAFLVFMLFIKMVFFLSANNQVFQGSSTMFAFWILLFSRRYFRSFDWSKTQW